jgi:hypothetical protein
VKLTISLHLKPRLRNVWSYISTSSYIFTEHGDNFISVLAGGKKRLNASFSFTVSDYSPLILPFNTLYSEILKELLNKRRLN